jgi:hypothetical protein
MRFYRLNLDTNVEYEAIRASVDSQIGYSGSLTCISPYATAPQDQKGRVLLSLTDNQPGYESLLAAFSGLAMVKKAKELTQDEYDASFFPAPSGGGGGVSSWNDLTDKPTSFTPSAHASSHASGGSDPITVTWSSITGAPTFAAVATSGAYADLSGKPTIPNITSGTAAPSGGSSGDIYLRYS